MDEATAKKLRDEETEAQVAGEAAAGSFQVMVPVVPTSLSRLNGTQPPHLDEQPNVSKPTGFSPGRDAIFPPEHGLFGQNSIDDDFFAFLAPDTYFTDEMNVRNFDMLQRHLLVP